MTTTTTEAPAEVELPARMNYSSCPWPGTRRARFLEREDDRHYYWWGHACTGCEREVWVAPGGIVVHSALGPRPVDL